MLTFEQTLGVAAVTALFTLLANGIYSFIKSSRESKRNLLRERLTKLLLPLYFTLQEHEIEWSGVLHVASYENWDPYEFQSDAPKRLLGKLKTIIEGNIYLADDELHKACIDFISWAMYADEDDRFQRLHGQGCDEDSNFVNFNEIVMKKYFETRKGFLT